ncbi:MAG: YgiQ family radical SAM protein, partial [Fervidobacterium sp.]
MFLPTTAEELEKRKWNSLDVIFVTGDAYIDHPSFGVALLGRLLESKGYKVGIIAQPTCIDDIK